GYFWSTWHVKRPVARNIGYFWSTWRVKRPAGPNVYGFSQAGLNYNMFLTLFHENWESHVTKAFRIVILHNVHMQQPKPFQRKPGGLP
ncbi:hypothetical protein, partial [Paenibacillus koleovorans]|uniref:hypothetical protein n=1 Tax=Paenibacillus koleovorans TaxID=121608 RepID=UPI001C3FF602